jgi:hypothetical protein
MKTKKMLPLVILGSMLVPNACFGMQQPTWEQRAEGAFQKIAVLGTGLAALYTYYMTRPRTSKKFRFRRRRSPVEHFEEITELSDFFKELSGSRDNRFSYEQLARALERIESVMLSDSKREDFKNWIVDKALFYKVREFTKIEKFEDIYTYGNNQFIEKELAKEKVGPLNTREYKLWDAVLQRFTSEYRRRFVK